MLSLLSKQDFGSSDFHFFSYHIYIYAFLGNFFLVFETLAHQFVFLSMSLLSLSQCFSSLILLPFRLIWGGTLLMSKLPPIRSPFFFLELFVSLTLQ